MKINDTIKDYRMRRGLSEIELATAMDISKASYYDIELHDDELNTAYSMSEVFKLCRILGIPVGELYGQSSEPPDNGLTTLRKSIRAKMEAGNLSEDEVGEIVGWDIVPLLTDDTSALTYSADAFQMICEYGKCCFSTVINDLHQAWSGQVDTSSV